jgi:GT2 family glycosyltransferase
LLSIVVVSHESRPDVLGCLRSLRENPPHGDAEVFLVDNASTDGTAEAVRTEFPAVHVIARPVNDGFSAANNAALRQARGDCTLLLNPDTLVKGGAIDAMAAFMGERPDVGIVGCRLVNEHGETDASAGGLPGLRMQVASWLGLRRLVPRRLVERLVSLGPVRRALGLVVGGYFVPFEADPEPREVEFLSGACLMVRGEVWEQVGLLDERFFLYLEDADICRRAAVAGWRLVYLPGAAIVHLGGRSFAARSGGGTHHLSRERAVSLVYYFRKHGGIAQELAIRGVITAAVAPRLALRLLRGDRDQSALLASILRVAVSPRRSATQ